MDLKLLKGNIKTNNIPNFLIFAVDEPVLAKQYINLMSSTLNKYFRYYDSAKEVIYEISTNIKDDYLYIILNDSEALRDDSIIETLINSNRNIIMYYSDSGDCSKINNKYLNFIVNFCKVDKYTTTAYLLKLLNNNKINVDQKKLETLVDYCNCNFSLCVNEIDKIITLGQENSNLLMDYMLNNGFSDYRKVDIFRFVQKILNRDVDAFNDLLKLDESPVSVLNLLYKQARSKLISSNNNYYSKLLKLCFELDSGIKDGSVDASTSLNYLLAKLLFN